MNMKEINQVTEDIYNQKMAKREAENTVLDGCGEVETIEYDLDPGKYYIRIHSSNYGEYEFSYNLNYNFDDN